MSCPVRRVLLLLWLTIAGPLWAQSVLMISIDGLRPDYVTQADAHGLKIPILRHFLTAGSYAEGVVGVVPTVTYPSHTTLVTGVWPAEHGIYANLPFDPLGQNQQGWYWYAQDIKVPTLWEVADKAGIVTASVGWPVTVDAPGVRFLIPEFWRAKTSDDRKLLEAISRPDGWLSRLEAKLGPYDEPALHSLDQDEIRTKFAAEILRSEKPGFMTVHLIALDLVEHLTGPFSKETDASLEKLDGMIGRLIQAAVASDPSTVIVIVSDHGFLPVNRHVNLMLPFIKAGLVKLKASTGSSDRPRIASWDAIFWPAGATAAVVLRDAQDAALRERVKNLLLKLRADPTYGIARVIEQPELTKLGGFPNATFLVEMKPGTEPTWALSGPLVQPAPGTGEHGYLPDRPELRASFFIMGGKVYPGRNLGVIDMRQIAPTLAMILNLNLTTARGETLSVIP